MLIIKEKSYSDDMKYIEISDGGFTKTVAIYHVETIDSEYFEYWLSKLLFKEITSYKDFYYDVSTSIENLTDYDLSYLFNLLKKVGED